VSHWLFEHPLISLALLDHPRTLPQLGAVGRLRDGQVGATSQCSSWPFDRTTLNGNSSVIACASAQRLAGCSSSASAPDLPHPALAVAGCCDGAGMRRDHIMRRGQLDNPEPSRNTWIGPVLVVLAVSLALFIAAFLVLPLDIAAFLVLPTLV
jgi:hypothetical protein